MHSVDDVVPVQLTVLRCSWFGFSSLMVTAVSAWQWLLVQSTELRCRTWNSMADLLTSSKHGCLPTLLMVRANFPVSFVA